MLHLPAVHGLFKFLHPSLRQFHCGPACPINQHPNTIHKPSQVFSSYFSFARHIFRPHFWHTHRSDSLNGCHIVVGRGTIRLRLWGLPSGQWEKRCGRVVISLSLVASSGRTSLSCPGLSAFPRSGRWAPGSPATLRLRRAHIA